MNTHMGTTAEGMIVRGRLIGAFLQRTKDHVREMALLESAPDRHGRQWVTPVVPSSLKEIGK